MKDFIINDLDYKDKVFFDYFLEQLVKLKFNLKPINIPEFNLANNIIEEEGAIVNYEAWHTWKGFIKKDINKVDKNVYSRFKMGKKMSHANFLNVRNKLSDLKRKIYARLEYFDFLILPTLRIKPPKINEVLDNRSYKYYNNLVLGNTRIANLFDFPAITIPIKRDYWLSFSILGKAGEDEKLLNTALEIESNFII